METKWNKTQNWQNFSTKAKVEIFRGHTNAVYKAVFSDDGLMVLTASYVARFGCTWLGASSSSSCCCCCCCSCHSGSQTVPNHGLVCDVFLLRRCLGWHGQTLVCPHWRVYQNLLWPQRRGRFGCLCQRWFDSDGVCRPHCKGPFLSKFLDVRFLCFKIFVILHSVASFVCVATKLCHRCGTCKPPSAFKHSADLEADIRRRMWSDWSWGHWWWLYVCVAKHLWMISFLTATHCTRLVSTFVWIVARWSGGCCLQHSGAKSGALHITGRHCKALASWMGTF